MYIYIFVSYSHTFMSTVSTDRAKGSQQNGTQYVFYLCASQFNLSSLDVEAVCIASTAYCVYDMLEPRTGYVSTGYVSLELTTCAHKNKKVVGTVLGVLALLGGGYALFRYSNKQDIPDAEEHGLSRSTFLLRNKLMVSGAVRCYLQNVAVCRVL